MPEPFTEVLAGGHHNSLGRTDEVVGIVLDDHDRLEELYAALESADELVRMRAGDALEKVCRECPGWFEPHAERILTEVGAIDQPSVRWHTAQILEHIRPGLTPADQARATALVQGYLTDSDDWIVLNTAMKILAGWSETDPDLAIWLAPQLDRLSRDRRKSVARRAAKLRAELEDSP